ncbi:phosphoglycerate mutase [Acidovorax sp.]|uniref:phosphoglycerate mutase n=1 Tax=Acidovorax sp. TaxID=1872122 RepID=UPI003BAE8B0F
MSDPLHLLVPYAASHHPGCQHALQTLSLPHLNWLLRHLQRTGSDTFDEDHPAMPHERALARALGLPGDGANAPWAAWQVQQQTQAADAQAWAFVTPCHWQVGTDHITLRDPQALALDEAASRALLDIVAPWLQSDGIALTYDQPTRWLASGALLAHLATPSLERAQGSDVRGWLQHQAQTTGQQSAQVQAAQTWQRLHSELQMLLYTHPFNDARSAQGLLPVNAFWVHGAGRLDTAPQPNAVQVQDTLRASALRQDWDAWAKAWTALDAGPLAQLHAQVARGVSAQLTLCGQRSAITWHTGQRSLRHKFLNLFRPQRFIDVREQL